MAESDDLIARAAELEAELARVSKLAGLGELAAGVIHEINSPIASIFSNIDVLEKSIEALEKELGVAASPRSKRLLETMRSLVSVDKLACQRISGIVRSLKVHSRTEEEKFRDVQLSEILDDTIRLVGAEYKRRVRIETHYDEIPPVAASAQLLSQVFLNILVNGAQAIDGEGTITVTLTSDGKMAHVAIRDTGAGMTPDCKKRLFSTGFSTKAVGLGSGFGLSISRQIVVERHRGSIDFESEVGQGTTFHIRIPHQAAEGN